MDFVGGINGEPIRLDQSRLSIILSYYNVDILLVSFISFSDVFPLENSSQHLFHWIIIKISSYLFKLTSFRIFWILKAFEVFSEFSNFQNLSNFQSFNFSIFQILAISNFQNSEISKFLSSQTYEFSLKCFQFSSILNSWNFNFSPQASDFQSFEISKKLHFSKQRFNINLVDA